MHLIFETYELVQQIASHLPKGSALAMAKTCQSMSSPALNIVWQDMKSFMPLIRLLPRHLYHDWLNGVLGSPTPVHASDLARFHFYAVKVRSMNWERDHLAFRSGRLALQIPAFLEEVARANVAHALPLLPGLQRLTCWWTTWREITGVKYLLPSTLRSLKLRYFRLMSAHADPEGGPIPRSLSSEATNDVISFISTISTLPNLSHLSIGHALELLDPTAIGPCYQSLFSLASPIKTLSIKLGDNRPLLWSVLGRMPKLSSLSVFYDQSPQMHHLSDGADEETRELFKSLRSLVINGDLMEEVAELLGLISSREILSAGITIYQRISLCPTSLFSPLYKWKSLTSLTVAKEGFVFVFMMSDIRPLLANCHGMEVFDIHGHGSDIEDEDMAIIAKSWPNIRIFKLNYRLDEDLILNHHPRLTLFGLHLLLAFGPSISDVSLCFCTVDFPETAGLPERGENAIMKIIIGGCGKNRSDENTRYNVEMVAKGYRLTWSRNYSLRRFCPG